MGKIATIPKTGNCQFTIGTGGDCDISLSSPDYFHFISPLHAVLRRTGKNYFIKDAGSSQGTYVNGRKVGRKWVPIALHDDIYLGKCPFKIAGLLLRDQQITLEACNLNYTIQSSTKGLLGDKHKRTLTNQISFRVEPGELVGILGPSGAGKTVLLNLLNGALDPGVDSHGNKGAVIVNGRFTVHKDQDFLRDFIGYVPQDDMLIPELTVRKSLSYSLELKYADSGIDNKFRDDRIKQTVQKLGFSGEKTEQYLDTIIGSADTQRGLSGGERKKANIAHELIKNPLLLFLDEPTSGLSSVDSDNILQLLKTICDRDKTTTLLTIHQPSETSFKLFDKVLILNYGGTVAFYGTPVDAVSYFQGKSGVRVGSRNPAEFILETLDRWTNNETPEESYDKTVHASDYAPKSSLKNISDIKVATRKLTLSGAVRQFLTLIKRNFSVFRSDTANLFFQIIQPLMIAALILFSFSGFHADYKKQDHDDRVAYYLVKDGQSEGLSFTSQKRENAIEWAGLKENQKLLSVGAANRLGAIYFLMLVSSIWIGVINTCREIVGEKAVLKREGRSYLRLSSYLLSKFMFFSVLSILQVGIIAVAVNLFLLPEMSLWFMWALMALTASSSASIGLALSALVNTQRSALTVVPIVMIPQLLLGGLVRPIRYLHFDMMPIFDCFHHVMLQKWVFLASLIMANHNGIQVLEKVINFSHFDATKRISYDILSLVELFFGTSLGSSSSGMSIALSAVSVHTLLLLALAYILLRTKYVR